MRKFIFTANVIALMALVPAIVFGYLHASSGATENKTDKEVIARDVTNGQDDGSTFHLLKSF